MLVTVGIGVFYARKSNENTENYFLGGRSLGPWITAMSAEASDMSGWLLMGLPGVAYWCGIADAAWTAIGLAIGTYVNWLVVARRLRSYSIVAGDAITIPEFFSNRFKEKKKAILTIAALFILIFFTVYAASCFVTCGKLFSSLFGFDYKLMMLLGALIVILYTPARRLPRRERVRLHPGDRHDRRPGRHIRHGTAAAGGFGQITENVKDIPGFLSFFGIAQPEVVDGVQQVAAARPYSARPAPTALSPFSPAWPGDSATSACRRFCSALWPSANPARSKNRAGLRLSGV